MPISDCRLLDLPKVPNLLGNLSFIEGERHIPFAIERVYYLYDVPGGAERGGHAHRELQQLAVDHRDVRQFRCGAGRRLSKAALSSESLLSGSIYAHLDLAGTG